MAGDENCLKVDTEPVVEGTDEDPKQDGEEPKVSKCYTAFCRSYRMCNVSWTS